MKQPWPIIRHREPFTRPDGVRLGSLGVHEHWNNPSDRKYSRNLGMGAGIELVDLAVHKGAADAK